MSDGLKIQIGADVNDAVKGIGKVDSALTQLSKVSLSGIEKELDRLQKSGSLTFDGINKSIGEFQGMLKKATNPADIVKLTSALTSLQNRAKSLRAPGGFDDFTQKMGALRTKTADANNVLTNTSRVIQDLPFGFLGIANNLNPLLESFQRLKAESGSTGSAVKAFAGSLIGGGGLGLALSVASSLILEFGTSFTKAAKAFTDAEFSLARFKLELQKFVEQVDELKTSLDFQNKLDRLNFEAAFGSGTRANVAALGAELKNNIGFLEETTRRIQDLRDQARQAIKLAPITLSKDANKLLDQFKDRPDFIPDEFIQKLDQDDKIVLTKIRDFNNEANKLVDEQQEIFRRNKLIPFEIKIALKKDAFEAIRIGLVKGLNDVVDLMELNPTKISVPFQLALDENKLQLQFSALKKQLEDKLHQFDLKPSVIPVDFQLQIKDAAKIVKPLTDEIRKQFADLKSSQFGISNVDLGSIFNTDGMQDALAGVFDKIQGIGGELADIRDRGDFTLFAQQVQKASEMLTSVLEPAFKSFFDEVVNGQFKIKTFFQSLEEQLKQLTSRLLTNAAIAAVIAAATGGNFSSIFKGLSGFREKGGPVEGGLKYIVNEKGPEMFFPKVGNPAWITGGPHVFSAPIGGQILSAQQAKQFATNFKIPKLELGGIVSRPTFALLGEGGNPEVVAPLNTLPALLGINGNNVNVKIESKTRGNDILHTVARQERKRNRLS